VRALKPGARILEIGCGTGNYIHALARGGRADLTYVGLDISKPMLREARATRSLALFVGADAARALPCHDGACELAFAVDVVHHIDDLAVFFREGARVLSPTGRLVVVTDSEETLRQRSLTKYFPEILPIELRRYPPLEALHRHAAAAGLRLEQQEPAAGHIPLTDDFVRRLEARCSSAMRLLEPAMHAAGMARVREAQAHGESWLSIYAVLSYAP